MKLQQVSDAELVARVHKLCRKGEQLAATLLVLLVEIEERRLHLKEACSSMQEYCMRRFGMSASQAWRRATAARLVHDFPVLLAYVKRGEVDLSTLVLLRNFITAENAEELVRATRCRSKRDIERFLSTRAPRPDAAARMRKRREAGTWAARASGRLEAVSEELYRLEVTIPRRTRAKIVLARDLLRYSNVSDDLVDVVDRAFDALLESLERLVTENGTPIQTPKATTPIASAKSHHIPRATRRKVLERDGHRCVYESEDGVRCRATRRLEVDHITPRAAGGSDELPNLRTLCRPHNRLYAELIFGKEFIERCIKARQATAAATRRPAGSSG